MSTSSTFTFSIGSGERKRCSNMAPVRRLRSLAWMKARRLPGVRCSTLKTECRSLLCLMIMPGRSWVAGIDIARKTLLVRLRFDAGGRRASHKFRRHVGLKCYFTLSCGGKETFPEANSSKTGGLPVVADPPGLQGRTRINLSLEATNFVNLPVKTCGQKD